MTTDNPASPQREIAPGVERYGAYVDLDGALSHEGRYVKWTDYAALQQRCAELERALAAAEALPGKWREERDKLFALNFPQTLRMGALLAEAYAVELEAALGAAAKGCEANGCQNIGGEACDSPSLCKRMT